jgi:hypothetical protein
MIKKLYSALTLILLLGCGTAVAQNVTSASKLIQKIDSLAKANRIYDGEVKSFVVTTSLEKTSTDTYTLGKKGSFSFDGDFLVIAETYFNMNKLLYFKIKDKSFKFFFHAY